MLALLAFSVACTVVAAQNYGFNYYSNYNSPVQSQGYSTFQRSNYLSSSLQGRGGAWPEIPPVVVNPPYFPVQPPPPPPPDYSGGGGSPPDMSGYLPPVNGISESQLYGSVNVDALTKPYASGENSRVDEKPIQLPDIVGEEVAPGQEFDHVYPPSYKNQDVVSNKEIHTYSNQDVLKTINVKNLHRDHKLITANTNYITNVQHINQATVLRKLLKRIANEHQPYLYVVLTKNDVVKDSPPVNLPPVITQTDQLQELPPVIGQPIVKKYGYGLPPVVIGQRPY